MSYIPVPQLALAEIEQVAVMLDNQLIKRYIKALQIPVMNDILEAQKSEDETREEFQIRVENAKGIIHGLQLIHDISKALSVTQPQQ